MSFLKFNLLFFAYILIILASIFTALFLFEIYTDYKFSDKFKIVYNPKKIGDLYSKDITITTMYMDLPANTHFVLGPQSIKNQDIKTEWIKYKNGYTVSTNKFGFMTKYPIDKYPVKKDNEYRILLVGGSGAQGWGAQTNSHMFHNKTENMLNKYFSKENIKIDIINLAQAGTTIFNSSETLNIYGKYLKADMIMAYFGVNDISQITNTRMFYKNISYGVLPAKRFANYDGPPVMENFKKLFPTVTMVYDLENKIADYFGAPRDYSKSLGIFNRQFIPNAKNINPSIWYKKYLVPEIIKELKRIKRTFCGKPIVLVKQIWNAPPWPSLFLERVRKVKLKKPNEAYKYWWRELENKLKNYVNKSWFFINAQDDIWKQIKKTSDIKITDSFFNFEDDIKRYKFRWIDEKNYFPNNRSFGVHLDNIGHLILSDYLFRKLVPIIQNDKKIDCDTQFFVR